MQFINNNRKEVGDYQWFQLSMWDFSPPNCIEMFIKSNITTTGPFHYILKCMYERVSETHTKWYDVTDITNIPENVLQWREGAVYIKIDGKSIKYEKGE